MKTLFTVTGIAFVPVEMRMKVLAETAEEAMHDARRVFKRSPISCRDYIVPGSVDESSVFDFNPSEATEVKDETR